jgi:TolB protein
MANRIRSFPPALMVVAALVLAFASATHAAFPGRNGKVAYTGPGLHLWVVRPDGDGARQLTHGMREDFEPAWSPSGHRVVFRGDLLGASRLYVMNRDGSHLRAVPHTGGHDAAPSWSPDGKRIVFQSDRADDISQIWTMRLSGKGLRRLTHGSKWSGRPVWSPNGRKIAFERQSGVFVIDADGGGAHRIVETRTFAGPSFSPDGRRLAFERDGVVFIARIDGSHQHRVTPGAQSDESPAFAPNGRRVVFNRYERDYPYRGIGIFSADLSGAHERRLTTAAGGKLDWQPLAR